MALKWCVLIAIALSTTNLGQICSTEHLFDSISIIARDPASLFQRKLLFYANYKTTSNTARYYFNDVVNSIAPAMDNISYKILFQTQKTLRKTKTLKVLLFEDIESLRRFYQKIYNNGNYNLSLNLMFISTITTLDTETLTMLFAELFRMSILNVALIVELSKDDIVMVSYFPFTPTSCFSVTPVITNRYDTVRQQWIHTDYFPPKSDNFYGCPLTCAIWENTPYIELEHNETLNRVSRYEGFEGKLLEFAAEQLNFTSKIYVMSTEEIDETFNETGLIFEKIFDKTADFSLGGYYYKSDLENTAPYTQTDYYYLSHTYLVTNVFNVYSTYEKIAYPFTALLWYIIGITFALSSAIICACEYSGRRREQRNFIIGDANTTPQYYLYTLAMGAGMPSAQLPRYNFARFLLICWLLAMLIIRSAYQAGMYEMFRDNKHRHPPQTIADVLRQNYVVLLKRSHKGLFNTLPDMKNVRELNGSIMQTFPEMAKVNERTAIVTNYEYFGYFGKMNSATWHRLHLVKERIYTQQLAMNVRRQSYLMDELNNQIISAQTYGFATLWAREYFGKPSDKRDADHDAEMAETNIMSMNELGAVFMILIWSHLFAVAVFIMELMWHKWGATVLLAIGKN